MTKPPKPIFNIFVPNRELPKYENNVQLTDNCSLSTVNR